MAPRPVKTSALLVSTFALTLLVGGGGCSLITGAENLTTVDCLNGSCKADEVKTSDTAPTFPTPAEDGGSTPPGNPPKGDASPQPDTDAPSGPGGTPVHEFANTSCEGNLCQGSETKPYCCVRETTQDSCVNATESCNGIRAACDDKNDCDNGEVCCVYADTKTAYCTTAAKCQAASAGNIVCDLNADCPGTMCNTVLNAFQHWVCTK